MTQTYHLQLDFVEDIDAAASFEAGHEVQPLSSAGSGDVETKVDCYRGAKRRVAAGRPPRNFVVMKHRAVGVGGAKRWSLCGMFRNLRPRRS